MTFLYVQNVYKRMVVFLKLLKKIISHHTLAQHTPSRSAIFQVSHALITILQCVHHGSSYDTHPHGNQTHPRPGIACPL